MTEKEKLDFDAYCLFYANKCEICNGTRSYVSKDGVLTGCPCQEIALKKFQFDKIRVSPQSLKSLTWDDFTGVISESGTTTGILDPESVIDAKKKALEYCYKNGNSSDDNIVTSHLIDGKNIIIAGDRGTGKSLLAVLLCKAVIVGAVHKKQRIRWMWVNATEIRHAAQWSAYNANSEKSIDFAFMDHCEDADFLFIDGMDIELNVGHHTIPPDRISLNHLFLTRDVKAKPTIIMCSNNFYTKLYTPQAEVIRQQWGDDLYNLVTKQGNVLIHLKK